MCSKNRIEFKDIFYFSDIFYRLDSATFYDIKKIERNLEKGRKVFIKVSKKFLKNPKDFPYFPTFLPFDDSYFCYYFFVDSFISTFYYNRQNSLKKLNPVRVLTEHLDIIKSKKRVKGLLYSFASGMIKRKFSSIITYFGSGYFSFKFESLFYNLKSFCNVYFEIISVFGLDIRNSVLDRLVLERVIAYIFYKSNSCSENLKKISKIFRIGTTSTSFFSSFIFLSFTKLLGKVFGKNTYYYFFVLNYVKCFFYCIWGYEDYLKKYNNCFYKRSLRFEEVTIKNELLWPSFIILVLFREFIGGNIFYFIRRRRLESFRSCIVFFQILILKEMFSYDFYNFNRKIIKPGILTTEGYGFFYKRSWGKRENRNFLFWFNIFKYFKKSGYIYSPSFKEINFICRKGSLDFGFNKNIILSSCFGRSIYSEIHGIVPDYKFYYLSRGFLAKPKDRKDFFYTFRNFDRSELVSIYFPFLFIDSSDTLNKSSKNRFHIDCYFSDFIFMKDPRYIENVRFFEKKFKKFSK